MKVFSRDKYFEDMEGYWCYNNLRWIDKCHMKTPEECKPFSIVEDWLVPCREVKRRAKTGEYVRVTENTYGFKSGDIVECVGQSVWACFRNEQGSELCLATDMYVVREIVEEEEKMENVKQLLKNGDMVITRNGEKYIFMKDYLGQNVFKDKDGEFCYLSSYDKDLICKLDGFTVIEIKEPKRRSTRWFNEAEYETKWKREEVKEMTVAEIEKELGYKVKVVKG